MADTKDRLKKIIHELLDELVVNEESTSDGAGAYMTPNAFTGGKAANERKRKQTATVLGMKIVEPQSPKSIKKNLDEITADNTMQAGYLVKTAFSKESASDKAHMRKTATVLGYQFHPSVAENYIDTNDELLNEELAITENDYSRDEFVPDQVYTSGEVSEEHYKGYEINNTADGKFYSPDYDKNRKSLSLRSLEDIIDAHIEELRKSQADGQADGLAEDTTIQEPTVIDQATGLKKIKVQDYNAIPTNQRASVGGKKGVVARNKDGEPTVNLVTT